jgi:hypothetical protein
MPSTAADADAESPGAQESADLASYAELRDLFRTLNHATGRADWRGGNFCSGGDVHEIIGPLTMGCPLLEFTRMTATWIRPARLPATHRGGIAFAPPVLAHDGPGVRLQWLGTAQVCTAFVHLAAGLPARTYAVPSAPD